MRAELEIINSRDAFPVDIHHQTRDAHWMYSIFLFLKEATREHYLQYWADNGTIWFPLLCFITALIRSEKQG